VVEILSPSTAYYDLRKKFKVYEQLGVKEYWIVDPKQKAIQVFVLNNGKFALDQEGGMDGAVQSPILNGLTVKLDEIFR
jgi:Uma2 family endonuclease